MHLAGILFERPASSYQTANVDATKAVVDACRKAGVRRIVLVSVLGADPTSPNRYWRSKGRAERIVSESGLSGAIIRTGILLGSGMAGARAVVHAASQPVVTLLGGGRHSIRPLDVDDLSRAILRCCESSAPGVAVYELVGPEPAAYRDVVARTAALMDRHVSIRSMPVWLARLGAALSGWRRQGGMTPTVIDVITSSEVVHENADAELGVLLTPLSTTLEKLLPSQVKSGPLVTESAAPPTTTPATGASKALGRMVFLAIAAACFVFLYYRLNGAATREGLPLVDYMTRVFANVRWLPWLLLMMVYSCFYLMIDTLVLTRALSWFIKPIRYRDILPIRASAYIISLFSEQVGKGVMAYFLNRRYDVPGWEVASVMLFIMFGEIFYLLTWASVGYMISGSSLPAIFGWMPVITLGADGGVYAVGALLPRDDLSGQPVSREEDFPRVQDGDPEALLPVLPAALSRSARGRAGVHHRVESVRGPGFAAAPARLSADHLLCRDGANADARGCDHALGRPVPTERGSDGRLRIRAAQLLHPVQCADRCRVPAPRPTRAVRSVMANALTAVRLALALPIAVALARPICSRPASWRSWSVSRS